MKQIPILLTSIILIASSCTSQKKLAYLNNLSETGGEESFTMAIPDYKIQYRDILYISVKGMTTEGLITDFLSANRTSGGINTAQNEAGQYLLGYDVNSEGEIVLPVVGSLRVAGLTLEEAGKQIQILVNSKFNNATVECKLLSFKFTIIGEVKMPGTFINYNNYLTVLEAIGRAGGISDYGKRDKIIIVRPVEKGTKIYTLNLQDKNILTSEAYFIFPNDVIIVQPESKKIFSLNLPTFSFIITAITSAVTTTLLLINYYGK